MVAIREEIVSGMIGHAMEDVPNECCGILAGDGGVITTLYRVESEEKSPRSYFMVPERQVEVMMDIEKKGLEMMGIYHSHPGLRPYPSRRDIEMAFYPECFYFIVSVWEDRDPRVKVFNIADGRVGEEDYAVV